MAKAILTAAAVYVDCPRCSEGQSNPVDGSFMWETNYPWPDHIVCQNAECGAKIGLTGTSAMVRRVYN